MVWQTPQIIKSATAGSHIAVWLQQHYSTQGMFFFTLIFGYLGLHHVLLKAPLIAILFLLGNSLTSGYWYWFDLFQLAFTEVDDLNKYGLGSPFLFEFGVAVGMWQTGGATKGRKGEAASGPTGAPATGAPATGAPATGAPATGAPATGAPATGATGTPLSPYSNATDPDFAKFVKDEGIKCEEKKPNILQTGGGEPQKPKEKEEAGKGLAASAQKLAETILQLLLGWLSSTRKEQPMKTYDWTKVASNTWTYSFIVFFFILSAPIGPLSSAIAGDMWGAVFHLFNPFFLIISIIETFYIIFFPMDVFINGVSRPFPYPQIFTSIDIDGRSPNIQRTTMGPVDPDAAYEAIKPFVDIAGQGMGIAEGLLAYVPLAAGGKLGNAADKFANAALETAQAQAKAPKKGGFVQRGGAAAVAEEKAEAPQAKTDTVSLAVIGAVLLGGLFLGVGRNILNVVQGKDDSPPNTGRV